MKIILCLTIAGLLFSSCSEDPNTSLYKLTVEISGHGSYFVSPQKSDYEDGESVTITAVADSGWKFKKWEGSVNTNYNPLQLIMDGNKSIKTVFVIPFEPIVTGKWNGIEYAVTFNISQASIFDSTLSGTLVLNLNNGSTLQYAVTGYNRPPLVVMNCKKSGYYPITYTGWRADYTKIDGGMTENGVYYRCDLLKTTDYPLTERGKSLNPKRIAE
jgi:hypothetical protein